MHRHHLVRGQHLSTCVVTFPVDSCDSHDTYLHFMSLNVHYFSMTVCVCIKKKKKKKKCDNLYYIMSVCGMLSVFVVMF